APVTARKAVQARAAAVRHFPAWRSAHCLRCVSCPACIARVWHGFRSARRCVPPVVRSAKLSLGATIRRRRVAAFAPSLREGGYGPVLDIWCAAARVPENLPEHRE